MHLKGTHCQTSHVMYQKEKMHATTLTNLSVTLFYATMWFDTSDLICGKTTYYERRTILCFDFHLGIFSVDISLSQWCYACTWPDMSMNSFNWQCGSFPWGDRLTMNCQVFLCRGEYMCNPSTRTVCSDGWKRLVCGLSRMGRAEVL